LGIPGWSQTILEIKHADTWSYDAESGTQVLEGNVDMAYEGMMIRAARIRFKTSQETNELEAAEAEGSVQVIEEGKVARGERAECDFRRGLLHLKGNASVQQGNNVIQAKEIHFVRDSSAMTAVGTVSGNFAGPSGGAQQGLRLEKAEKWVFDPAKHLHDLQGNPVVHMQDTKISASRIMLQMDEKDEGILRADTEPPVEIVKGDLRATADSATYFPAGDAEERLVLKGNAKMYQGQNFMSGDEIIFFPATGSMKGKNVQVTIQVEENAGGMP